MNLLERVPQMQTGGAISPSPKEPASLCTPQAWGSPCLSPACHAATADAASLRGEGRAPGLTPALNAPFSWGPGH